MADNTTLNSGSGGDVIRSDDIGGVKFPTSKITLGADGADGGFVSSANPLPVSDAGGSLTVDGPLTDAQLRASAVPVSGTFFQATQPISGTVTANAGSNLNTSTLALEAGGNLAAAATSLATLDNIVAGNEAQVDVITLPALPAGDNNIGNVDIVTMPAVTLDALPAGTNNIGDVDVLTLPSLPAGNNNIGDVDIASLPSVTLNALPAGTNNIGDVDVLTLPAIPTGTNTIGRVGLTPQTAGGLSAHKTISAASTNATSVKGSAGQLFGWYISNVNAAARYLKLYNKATAPTVGTDTPVMTLLIPGNTAGVAGHVEMTNGIDFTTGIAFALTTGAADADTGVVAANEQIVNLFYK
jgi:hypothetical protein